MLSSYLIRTRFIAELSNNNNAFTVKQLYKWLSKVYTCVCMSDFPVNFQRDKLAETRLLVLILIELKIFSSIVLLYYSFSEFYNLQVYIYFKT